MLNCCSVWIDFFALVLLSFFHSSIFIVILLMSLPLLLPDSLCEFIFSLFHVSDGVWNDVCCCCHCNNRLFWLECIDGERQRKNKRCETKPNETGKHKKHVECIDGDKHCNECNAAGSYGAIVRQTWTVVGNKIAIEIELLYWMLLHQHKSVCTKIVCRFKRQMDLLFAHCHRNNPFCNTFGFFFIFV